jgi:K+-transporting ATPase ATPase C chain
MKQHLKTALLMTIVTTILLGIVYPLVVTGLAQVLMRDKANGQLLERDGRRSARRSSRRAFRRRRISTAGRRRPGRATTRRARAAPTSGPTNKKLIDSVTAAVVGARKDNPGAPVPIDLVTTSASGFDPHLSPDAAMFQVPRVARTRGIDESELRQFVAGRIEGRQLGFLGEPRVNVLLLNLAMDERWPAAAAVSR